MAILQKAIYINVISIKIPTQFFTDLERRSLNFIWKNKNPRMAKTILKIKITSRSISIPDIKLYDTATLKKNPHGIGKQTKKPSNNKNPHMFFNVIELKTHT